MTYDVLDRLLTRTINGTLADTFSYSPDGRIMRGTRKNVSRDSIFLDSAGQIDSIVRGIAGHRYAIVYRSNILATSIREIDSIKSNVSIPFSQETEIVHQTLSAVDSLTLTGAHEAGTSLILHNSDGVAYEIRWPDPGHAMLWFSTNHHQPYEIYPFYNNNTTVADSLGRLFTYDSLGRVIADHRFFNGHTIPGRQFVYDSLGQLLKVVSTVDSSCSTVFDSLALAFKYTCSHQESSVTTDSASYDNTGNRLFPGATYDTLTGQLLTGPSGVSYTYDPDGNLVTRTHNGVTDSLFWSATGLLDSVASGGSSGLRHQYEYNSFGQLVRRQTSVGGGAYSVDRYFLWDGQHLLAELAYPGTSRIAQYVYDGGMDRPFALVTDSGGTSKVRYFYPDWMEGNLTGIMKDSTTLEQYTQYTAWGQIQARPINTLADTNRLGWKGLVYEGDSTRLYYVRNRWYDPATGRFVSMDPLGITGGWNLYAFARNDPINGSDPSGLFGFGSIFGLVVDAISGNWAGLIKDAAEDIAGDFVRKQVKSLLHKKHKSRQGATEDAGDGSGTTAESSGGPAGSADGTVGGAVIYGGVSGSLIFGTGPTAGAGIYGEAGGGFGLYLRLGWGFGLGAGGILEGGYAKTGNAFFGQSIAVCANAAPASGCTTFNPKQGSISGGNVGTGSEIGVYSEVSRTYHIPLTIPNPTTDLKESNFWLGMLPYLDPTRGLRY
jgi:RHS repeat-associated protein